MTDQPTRTLPLAFWALDIETDNSEGFGLDPTKAQVISIALINNRGKVWYQSARTEEDEFVLLSNFRDFLLLGVCDGLITTWNGGAFDWPFLTTRCRHHRIPMAWQLDLRDNRKPKYDALTGYDGVYSVLLSTGAKHLDMAYVMDRLWCEERGIKWSLKPVAEHLAFRDHRLDMMAGSTAHEEDAHMLAAYNIHDSLITLRLALWASAFEHIPDLSFGMPSLMD